MPINTKSALMGFAAGIGAASTIAIAHPSGDPDERTTEIQHVGWDMLNVVYAAATEEFHETGEFTPGIAGKTPMNSTVSVSFQVVAPPTEEESSEDDENRVMDPGNYCMTAIAVTSVSIPSSVASGMVVTTRDAADMTPVPPESTEETAEDKAGEHRLMHCIDPW